MAYGIPVQSHLSESKGEIDFVKFLRPDNSFYGDSYNEYDLFGKNDDIDTDVKTVMAHCVWSTDEEAELIKRRMSDLYLPATNSTIKKIAFSAKRNRKKKLSSTTKRLLL